MKYNKWLTAIAISAFCVATNANAQNTPAPTYNKGSAVTTADGVFVVDKNGIPLGTVANPIYTTLPTNAAQETGGNLDAAVTKLNAAVTALNTLVSNVTAPLPSQATSGVLIGAIQGMSNAGSSYSFPVTIQGNSSGIPVPTTLAGAPPVTVAANSSGNVSLIQGAQSLAITASSPGTTQLVAAVTGQSIYVTHIHVIASVSAGFSLVYGTGTNCGTGTVYLDGGAGNTMSFTSNSGYAVGGGVGPVYIVPAGNALCAVFSTSANYAGSMVYTQQ